MDRRNKIIWGLLTFLIVFEGRQFVSPTIHTIFNTSDTSLPKERIFKTVSETKDVIHLGDEPKIIDLKEKTLLIYSINSSANLSFLVVQAHTQYQSLSLSLSTRDGLQTNTNSDTAVLKIISYPWGIYTTNVISYHQNGTDYVLRPPNATKVKTLVAGVSSVGRAPIPGGCCLTCSLSIDPNLFINSRRYYKTVLSFSLANVYDYHTSDCSGEPISEPKHYRLKYSIYQYFLEEGNLDDDELFDGISKMLTYSKVKENGDKIREWDPKTDSPSVVFDTERGQGIVFNVLVFDPLTNDESVYSPVATYGCSFTAKVDGCDSLGSIANLVLASCGALFGLFICFFGLRFYRLYILGSGLTLFSFIGFVVLTIDTEWSHDVRMIGSVCIGIVGGPLIYLLWWWTGYKYPVLYICGLPFGFLVGALVFFTPFGNLYYWKNDVNYWAVFFCITITTPCFFLLTLKTFAISVCSLVGAYGFIVGIDIYVKSSMTYIILNVIMRATVDDFVKYDVPFQSKDYILSASWGVIAVLGLIVQFYMSKGKPVLPHEVPRKKRERERTRRQACVAAVRRSPVVNNGDDPLPVLVNSRHGNRTIFFDDFDDDHEQTPILVESRSRVPQTKGVGQYSTKYGTNVVC
ncbi:transmembrane 7 superfamily member 3-like [Dendronephthya gigantea]|uniref:transmembrane 7 superfamily member 3-like n=1 Tax=Dendronephthya gigantea TaxID=151771 RepID=UPI00106ABE12|nr:transmembrane 7 superfamily member 3-like [Dendronephthya gigantea]